MTIDVMPDVLNYSDAKSNLDISRDHIKGILQVIASSGKFCHEWDNKSSPTWESSDHFTMHYPLFDLEDKVTANGRGNVMNTSKISRQKFDTGPGHVARDAESKENQGLKRGVKYLFSAEFMASGT
ncbi:Protein phosphatase 4 core regulatory subunit R [Senna tora]|uniref:Protein phosphatase 4 core regulatory subunit R n=1 Tax=Senna tora TaxID=362788 RepID=A0A834WY40_9FABA|nr:Protein phosphatase 4 core regulatory subunit R [Senna tora]